MVTRGQPEARSVECTERRVERLTWLIQCSGSLSVAATIPASHKNLVGSGLLHRRSFGYDIIRLWLTESLLHDRYHR